jgi:hypothetical protein
MLYLTGSEHGKILEHYNIMMCCGKVYGGRDESRRENVM